MTCLVEHLSMRTSKLLTYRGVVSSQLLFENVTKCYIEDLQCLDNIIELFSDKLEQLYVKKNFNYNYIKKNDILEQVITSSQRFRNSLRLFSISGTIRIESFKAVLYKQVYPNLKIFKVADEKFQIKLSKLYRQMNLQSLIKLDLRGCKIKEDIIETKRKSNIHSTTQLKINVIN